MRPRCHGPGVQVVALVPAAGPVPPPSIEVTPEYSASSTCCGQMKWMWRVEAAGGEDLALAGDDLGAGADDDGDAGLDVGIAGLADGGDVAVLDADVGFDDAPVIEDQRIGDDGVDGALLVGDLALAHAVADHLAAAELHLLAVDGEILFDLDDEIGVGQPHAVAGGRPEHVGIGGAFHFDRHEIIPAIINRVANRSCASSRRRIGLSSDHPSSAHAGHGWPPWPERAPWLGRGCCLQYSWSMFAGPGSQSLGTEWRAHARSPEMDPRACDGQTTVCPLWLLGVPAPERRATCCGRRTSSPRTDPDRRRRGSAR